MAKIPIPPELEAVIINAGKAELDFYLWIESINNLALSLQPAFGSGSPEGAIIASVGKFYIDQSAPVGTGLYVKESGDGATGWIQRS